MQVLFIETKSYKLAPILYTMANEKPIKVSGQQALTPIDQFKISLQREHEKAITNFFRGDKDKVMKFMSSVVYSLKKTPKLIECDKASLFNSFMTCAEYELYPSNVSGEAYVLPYNNKTGMEAQFQLGYQGVITLLYRAGMKNVFSEVVYANDIFEYEAGLTPKLVHKPKVFGDKGEAIGVYAVGTLQSGEKQFKVLSKEDIMKFKEFSKSKGSKFSPWNPENDPELSMWKKTAIKQLSKFLPKNSTIFEAFEKDNRDSKINDAKLLAEESDLKMGNLLKDNHKQEYDEHHNQESPSNEAEIQIEETDDTNDSQAR